MPDIRRRPGARPRARYVAPLGLGLGALVLGACGGGGGSSSAITLYSGQHPQTTQAIVQAFEATTGITVHVRTNDESTLVDQIVAEGSRSPADVILTENTPALEALQARQLLATLPSSTLDRTPARFASPARDWVGVSARVSVLVYNPSLIRRRDLPTSVLQLADARYRGEFALAPGETDFQPIVTSVLRAEGRTKTLAWLNGLKANSAGHVYPDSEAVTNEVNAGVAALGVINQYYWYRLRAEIGAAKMRSAIATFTPHDPGYVLDVSGAAVLASSRHRSAAQAFVAFLVSKQAQEVIAHSDSYEYPIASGVRTAEPEAPFSSLQPNAVTLTELGTGAEALALLREAQLL